MYFFLFRIYPSDYFIHSRFKVIVTYCRICNRSWYVCTAEVVDHRVKDHIGCKMGEYSQTEGEGWDERKINFSEPD